MVDGLPSLTPDITESLPALLSAKRTSQALTDAGAQWDVNIAGIGFMLAASDSNPYERQQVSPVKEQVDTSKEAGEQTLSTFWVRSQTSWHRGSGVNFYEPGSDPSSQYRADKMVGVNPWVQGELSLHHKLGRFNTEPAPGIEQYAVAALGYVFVNDAGTVARYTVTDATQPAHDVDIPPVGANTPAGPVVPAGTALLVGNPAGCEVCLNPTDPSPSFTKAWTLDGATGGFTVAYVKDRVVLANGPDLREVSLAGGDLGAVDPFFTHLDPDWTWTGVCESGTSILAAGYSGVETAIYQFSLVDPGSGGSPVLGAPVKVAVLPPGEQIHALRSYLGSYLGIGTNRGVRVGLVADNGSVQYGPLTVTATRPVRVLEGADRFLYAGIEGDIDGSSGAVRVDLSQPTSQDALFFAWAYDVQTHTTGEINSISLLPELTPRVLLGVTGEGLFCERAGVFEDTGYVLSGKIRFGTVEYKAFQRADVSADVTHGTVAVATVGEGGAVNTVYTMGAGSGAGRGIQLTLPGVPQEFIQLRLTLTPSGGGSPVLRSFQVKAWPKTETTRQVAFPLSCVDREQTAHGVAVGHDGWAWERVSALEEVQDRMVTVQVQDFTTGETFQGVLDQVSFRRPTPRGKAHGNFGGVLQVVARKVSL